MAKIYYDKDANLSLIRRKKVAIIGYGSQGHAHALNLKESGVQVRVGLPLKSKSVAKAKKAGLTVCAVEAAAQWADVIMVLVPDHVQARLYRESIAPHLTAGKMLMFAHGFNIRFGGIVPPKNVDVTMIAPKSPAIACAKFSKRAAASPASSRFIKIQPAKPKSWPCPTVAASAALARVCCRQPSPKRPRPICSVSKRCCAAVALSW